MMFGLPAGVWEAIGFLGQGLFTARFLVQWLTSEKRGESVVPVSFWWLSLTGSVVLAVYAVARDEPVFLLVSLINGFLYARNLILIHFRRTKPTSRRVLIPTMLAIGAFLLYAASGKLDADVHPGWLALGLVGTACWSGRFIIQWYASERAGKSVMPRSFWYVGLLGAVLLLSYSVHRKMPVFILGYLFPLFPYIRNLTLIFRKEGAPLPVVLAGRVWAGARSRRVAIAVLGTLLAAFLTARALDASRPGGEYLKLHRAGYLVTTGDISRLFEAGYIPPIYADQDHPPQVFDRMPTVAVLLSPLGLLPTRAGFVAWTLLSAFAFLLALWCCYRLVCGPGIRAAVLWLPFFLVLRFVWDSLNHGSIDPILLLLILAGLDAITRGRTRRGAVLAALAIVIEPVLLLVPLFLAVRGRGVAAASTVAWVLLLATVPIALAAGTDAGLTMTVKALESRIPDTTSATVTGESLRAMTCRLLDHAGLEKRGESIRISLSLMSRETAERAWVFLSAALLLVLVFRGRRCQAPLFFGMVLAAALLIDPASEQSTSLLLLLPAAALTAALRPGEVRGARDYVVAGLLLAALALAAIPARGIVGFKVALWFYALCASGFAALLLFAGSALTVGPADGEVSGGER